MISLLKVVLIVGLITIGYSVSHNIRNSQTNPLNSENEIHMAAEKLKIHVIAHTHDDVGWLKTLDEYFYGDRNDIQNAGVQYILDSVIDSLLKDPSKKFQYVEMAFFDRWWNQQTPELQGKVKDLVKNGQLEILNGGWCMNDESDAYFEDVIDQMTIGHQFIKDTFGVTPNIGWHIDPFGHQAAHASLFWQMGFNAWFFARIDYQDKSKRLQDKALEMIWHPRSDSNLDTPIFTGVLYQHYSAPSGFDYEVAHNYTPIKDDPRLEGYNIDQQAKGITDYFRNMANIYRTTTLMHTFGDDFNYQSASVNFKNYDKLFQYINQRKSDYNMEFVYSTVTDYLNEINQSQATYPTKIDDFLPYADNQFGYWTGYFTSRVASKGYIKDTGRYLMAMRSFLSMKLFAGQSSYLQDNFQSFFRNLDTLEQAMGVNQHHDAISGTEKQAVNDDYNFMIWNGTQALNQTINEVLKEETYINIGDKVDQYFSCSWNSTNSECPYASEALDNNKTVLLSVFNPATQGNERVHIIKLKVNAIPRFKILNYTNQEVYGEQICMNKDLKDCYLYFMASLTGFETTYYKLVRSSETLVRVLDFETVDTSQTFVINSDKNVTVRQGNSYQQCVCLNQTKCTIENFQINFQYYKSYQNPNGDKDKKESGLKDDMDQQSGAYIFRPSNDTIDKTLSYGSVDGPVKVWNGKIITQVLINYEDKIQQWVSFLSTNITKFNYGWNTIVEIKTFVDHIDVSDNQGKEIILDVQFDQLQNNGTFQTDSNGLELQKRVLNFRPSWDLQVTEPHSGNYYPINPILQISDDKRNITMLNDRSQAGSSLRNGSFQFMIHRRLIKDDSRGVGEPLNETGQDGKGLTQYLRHFIVIGNQESWSNEIPRDLQYNNDAYPISFIAKTENQGFRRLHNYKHHQKILLQKLFKNIGDDSSENIKIWLRPMQNTWTQEENGTYLFRLHNLNQYKSFPFKADFNSAVETTLTGNQSWEEWEKKQLHWKEESNQSKNKAHFKKASLTGTGPVQVEFVLGPMQFKTFIVRPLEESKKFNQK